MSAVCFVVGFAKDRKKKKEKKASVAVSTLHKGEQQTYKIQTALLVSLIAEDPEAISWSPLCTSDLRTQSVMTAE